MNAVPHSGIPGPARYVKLAPFQWYAEWSIGNRYNARLGPFWFRWRARQVTRRDVGRAFA